MDIQLAPEAPVADAPVAPQRLEVPLEDSQEDDVLYSIHGCVFLL